MTSKKQIVIGSGLLLLFLLVPLVTRSFDLPFYLLLATRIVIFAIAALSLDLILGYGGMASFGHSVFLGLGGYTVGIMAFHGIDNAWLQWPVALIVCATASAIIGLISLRSSGVYFLMITLALAQMLYLVAFSLKAYGGDDGLPLDRRSMLWPLNLADPTQFYLLCLGLLAVFYFLLVRLVRSRFGLLLRGSQENLIRLETLGFPTLRYRLVAFMISGTMCGVAGILLTNLTEVIAPSYMSWERSGELMIMVAIGGIGTLFGPIIGAAAFLCAQEIISTFTPHWQLFVGPALVVIVLGAQRGALSFRSRKRTKLKYARTTGSAAVS